MRERDLEQVRFASMFIGIQPIVDDFSEIIGCLIAFDERSSVFISGRERSSAVGIDLQYRQTCQ